MPENGRIGMCEKQNRGVGSLPQPTYFACNPSFSLGHTIKMISLIRTGTKVIPSRPFGYDQVVSTVPRAVYGAPSRPRLPIATSRGAPWMPVATTTASRGYLRRLAVVVVVATAPIYPTGRICDRQYSRHKLFGRGDNHRAEKEELKIFGGIV